MESPSVVPISELSDPRLAPYFDIRNRESENDRFIVEGRLPVERLLKSDYQVESLLLQQGSQFDYASFAHDATPVYVLPREHIRQLVGFDFHRGVLACARRKPPKRFDQFCALSGQFLPTRALALIGVSELENVGSLLRSAAAFGIRHVLLGPRTADPFSRRVIRVSMANVFKLTFYELDNPELQFRQLAKANHVRTIATTLDPNAVPLPRLKADDRPTVLMLGNEAEGLSPQLVQQATDQITIPMHDGVDSLNVAVAGAVLMYALSNPPHRPDTGR